MIGNNRLVYSFSPLGVVLLLCVFLPFLTGIMAQPVSAKFTVRKLTYVVEPTVQEDRSRLRVGLTFQGDSTGKSRLLLPLEWSFGVDLYKSIRNLQASSADVRLEDTEQPHVKTVYHPPNQSVSLSYEVISQPPGTPLTKVVYHNPVVRPSYFYVIGHALWVYPDMPEDTPLRVSLQWKNIPAGWTLINSFGANSPRQLVATTLNWFRRGTFLAGDWRVKRIVVNGQPIYAVTRDQWGFPDAEFHGLVQKLIHVMDGFWRGDKFPHYLVALLPTDDPLGDYSAGGEGRTNSFSVYLPKALTTLSEHRYFVAHELFHQWNPQRLGDFELIGGVENERLYWFSEGFTDYYAHLLLLRAGLISLDEYVALHNSWIEAYYTSLPSQNYPIWCFYAGRFRH